MGFPYTIAEKSKLVRTKNSIDVFLRLHYNLSLRMSGVFSESRWVKQRKPYCGVIEIYKLKPRAG